MAEREGCDFPEDTKIEAQLKVVAENPLYFDENDDDVSCNRSSVANPVYFGPGLAEQQTDMESSTEVFLANSRNWSSPCIPTESTHSSLSSHGSGRNTPTVYENFLVPNRRLINEETVVDDKPSVYENFVLPSRRLKNGTSSSKKEAYEYENVFDRGEGFLPAPPRDVGSSFAEEMYSSILPPPKEFHDEESDLETEFLKSRQCGEHQYEEVMHQRGKVSTIILREFDPLKQQEVDPPSSVGPDSSDANGNEVLNHSAATSVSDGDTPSFDSSIDGSIARFDVREKSGSGGSFKRVRNSLSKLRPFSKISFNVSEAQVGDSPIRDKRRWSGFRRMSQSVPSSGVSDLPPCKEEVQESTAGSNNHCSKTYRSNSLFGRLKTRHVSSDSSNSSTTAAGVSVHCLEAEGLLPCRIRQHIQCEGFLHRVTGQSNATKAASLPLFCCIKNGEFLAFSDEAKTSLKTSFRLSTLLSFGYSALKPESGKSSPSNCFSVGSLELFDMFVLRRVEKAVDPSSKVKESPKLFTFGRANVETVETWIFDLFQAVAPNSSVDYVKKGIQRAGYLYAQESRAGTWSPCFLLLYGRCVVIDFLGDRESDVIDLRKVSAVGIREIDEKSGDSPAHIGCVDRGTSFYITSHRRTWYFMSVYAEDTSRWRDRIAGAWSRVGKALEDQFMTEDDVPILVDKCVKFVSTQGSTTEGIYRRNGVNNKVASLVHQLTTKPWAVVLTLEDFSEHDAASAVRRFFRTLPEPLLTNELHGGWISAANIKDQSAKLAKYKRLFLELPPVNFRTLRKLISHLYSISSQCDRNLMPVQNLAPIWGPTLMTVESNGKEGKVAETNFTTTSAETDVMLDLIQFYPWLFEVSQKELEMEEKILQAMSKVRDGSSTVKFSGDMKVWVHLYEKEGRARHVTISPQTTARDIYIQLLREEGVEERWDEGTLWEICGKDGCVRRPLHHTEKVLEVVLQWTTVWREEDRASNYLLYARNTFFTELADSAPSENGPILLFDDLKFSDIRSRAGDWKLYKFKFSQAMVSVVKEEGKNPLELSWRVETVKWYLGCESKRNAPTKWVLSFLPDSVSSAAKENKWIGHAIAFPSEKKRLQWLAMIMDAIYPLSLVPPPLPTPRLLE